MGTTLYILLQIKVYPPLPLSPMVGIGGRVSIYLPSPFTSTHNCWEVVTLTIQVWKLNSSGSPFSLFLGEGAAPSTTPGPVIYHGGEGCTVLIQFLPVLAVWSCTNYSMSLDFLKHRICRLYVYIYRERLYIYETNESLYIITMRRLSLCIDNIYNIQYTHISSFQKRKLFQVVKFL